ncbi:MAG TPA: tetratricopeptide repeat protein [Pyrinomonadaceae bacterium]|nr:tetratricopeptide repeat protein [Pyrinomonadaceae bacterium]
MRELTLLFSIIILSFSLASAQTPPPVPPAIQANRLLERAKIYFELKEYDNARKDIADALSLAVDNAEIVNQAKQLSQRVLEEMAKKQKQDETKAKTQYSAQLAEAERLSSEGKYEKSSEIALSILKATTDPELVQKANRILESNRATLPGLLNTLPGRFLTISAWALDFVVALGVIAFLYLLLLLARRGWTAVKNRERKQAGRKWLVKPINDSTQLSVAEIITASMNRWGENRAPASAGLLRLEQLQIPTVPALQLPQVEVDLAPALEGLSLQLGAINIPAIGKALGVVRNWFNAKRLSIIGSATLVEGLLVVRLTRIDPSDKSQTVTATADKKDAELAAEAASYKMYYLIAKDSSVAQAEEANRLREGLKLLGEYQSGQGHARLEKALQAFQNVRQQLPDFYEAYLYEAIALDLLERHDEAIKRFQYLIQNAEDKELLQKAKYNLAVSRFRKYDPEELDLAIEELDALIKTDPATKAGVEHLVKSPVESLALAAKANAIAHKPIFWKRYRNLSTKLTEQEFLKYKKFAKAELDQWMGEVRTISHVLESVSEKVKDELEKAHSKERAHGKKPHDETPWDQATLTQLEWAIENATGNIYLNYAKSFLKPPHVPELKEPALREQYLNEAYDAFRRCEMLLTPGVETLTNLATTLLDLHRSPEAREYLDRARKINPFYEYGYFRTAEAWEQEGRRDEVLQLLRDFVKVKDPKIPSFLDVYGRYAVDLARPAKPATAPLPEPAAPPAKSEDRKTV